MTKTQRLEIENQVLRQSLDRIREYLEERDRMPPREQFDETTMSICLGHIAVEANYERYLKNALSWAEERETPAGARRRGNKKSSTAPLKHGEEGCAR